MSLGNSRVQFSPNTSRDARALISNSPEIDQTHDLGFYLGMSTVNGRVTRTTYGHILHKMNARLAGWKLKCMSPAGRVT